MSNSKAKPQTKKAELATLENEEITVSQELTIGIPSSIADRYNFKQLNYSYLVPKVGVPSFIRFLETSCKLKKVTGINDPVFATMILNLETGEQMILVLKKVLVKILVENELVKYANEEQTEIDLTPTQGHDFGVIAQENKTSKNGSRAYTPYTIVLLDPK